MTGSGSAARLAGGASGPVMSSKLSRPAAWAPSRAAPRPDAAGTSTAYSGTPSTSASSCRQPLATVPPPASRKQAGTGPAGPSSASRASRIANAVPSSADRSSDARSLASASEDHDPRSDGSQYGVRSPVRCGTKTGSPEEPEEPEGSDALAYSSSHDAFSTSRTQFRLRPALSVAPIWYQPDGEASRNRWTPASARLTGAATGLMTCAPVPTVNWMSGASKTPAPSAPAAVSPAPAATGRPAGSPSSAAAEAVSRPATAAAEGSSGASFPASRPRASTTPRSQRSPATS